MSPTYGWEHYAGDGAEVIWTPGSHASIFTRPDVQYLAENLAKLLDQVNQEEEDDA